MNTFINIASYKYDNYIKYLLFIVITILIFFFIAGWKKRIIIKGTAEQIALAVTQVQDKIREENEVQAQLKCEQAANARMPRSSPNKNIVEDEIEETNSIIKTYEIPVPYEMIGKVIGNNGNTIQQMERVLGVEIIIEKDPIFSSMYVENFIAITSCVRILL